MRGKIAVTLLSSTLFACVQAQTPEVGAPGDAPATPGGRFSRIDGGTNG